MLFISSAFTKFYNDDITAYGALTKTPAEPQDEAPYLKAIERHASTVTPKESSQAKKAAPKTKKRKLARVEEEEEADEENDDET